ncbi:MAG: cold shock domain-containing protein [Acidimicrobiales bacterium]|nr:cold shock domain-containing protein [Acidimicrobiales bacterium]
MAGQGAVAEFDEARGWGTIDAAGRTIPFHCTQISDGTRTIEVGTQVTFEVRPGGMGRWEAAAVTPVRASAPP